MPADIVNLRQVRKAKARAAKEADATRNRVKFGRTKAEKEQTSAANDLAARRLDQAHLSVAESDRTDDET